MTHFSTFLQNRYMEWNAANDPAHAPSSLFNDSRSTTTHTHKPLYLLDNTDGISTQLYVLDSQTL